MNSLLLFIISGIVLTLLFLYSIRMHIRSKRLQQFADLSIQVMQIEDQNKTALVEGSFVFQLQVKNKRVRHVIFEDVTFSNSSLRINNFNKLLLEIPAFSINPPLRSIGFSCKHHVLKAICDSKNSLTIRGFVVLNKQERLAFSYNSKISNKNSTPLTDVKSMQVA